MTLKLLYRRVLRWLLLEQLPAKRMLKALPRKGSLRVYTWRSAPAEYRVVVISQFLQRAAELRTLRLVTRRPQQLQSGFG